MSDNDEEQRYVVERRCQRADMNSDEYDKIRAEAPSKKECMDLFDHANKKRSDD